METRVKALRQKSQPATEAMASRLVPFVGVEDEAGRWPEYLAVRLAEALAGG